MTYHAYENGTHFLLNLSMASRIPRAGDRRDPGGVGSGTYILVGGASCLGGAWIGKTKPVAQIAENTDSENLMIKHHENNDTVVLLCYLHVFVVPKIVDE